MNRHFIVIALAFSLLLCSCTKDKNNEEGLTKATETTSVLQENSPYITADSDVIDYSQLFRTAQRSDELTIKGYNGNEKSVIVPSEINGVPVTKIEGKAFRNTDVEEIIFSEGIKEICGLKDAEKLRRIVIPSTVEEIDVADFVNLPMLKDIEVAEGGNFAVDNGFIYTNDMKTLVYGFNHNADIVIPNGVEHIGKYALYKSDIKSVEFPETLKTIENSAFSECNNLIYVDIPFGVTNIGEDAFYKSGLLHAELHNGIEYIGNRAFYNNSISEINLPITIKDIGYFIVNDSCTVYAYYPMPALNEYDPVYLGETRIQKAARLLPPISERTKGRVFIDMNYDDIPECIDYNEYYTNISCFADEKWIKLGIYGDKIYHFYDRKNSCDFYISTCYSEVGYYRDFVRFTPLKNNIAVDTIGYATNFNGIEEVIINGRFYMNYAEPYIIDTDKYIRASMDEYELIEVIDLKKISDEHCEEYKFNVYLDDGEKMPPSLLMTEEEYENTAYVDGTELYSGTSSYSTDNEEGLSVLSNLDKVVSLSLYDEWDDIECLKKYTNIKSLYINSIKDPSALAEMDNIESLTIIQADSYDFLADMEGVKVIDFGFTANEPDDFFKVIKGMKNLEYLMVDNYCDLSISEGQLEWLKENMPDLDIIYMY